MIDPLRVPPSFLTERDDYWVALPFCSGSSRLQFREVITSWTIAPPISSSLFPISLSFSGTPNLLLEYPWQVLYFFCNSLFSPISHLFVFFVSNVWEISSTFEFHNFDWICIYFMSPIYPKNSLFGLEYSYWKQTNKKATNVFILCITYLLLFENLA